MFRELIPAVRSAETVGRTGKIENIVGMSIEASFRWGPFCGGG